MNALIVDDELIARQVTAHTLTQAGYDVTTAKDGLRGPGHPRSRPAPPGRFRLEDAADGRRGVVPGDPLRPASPITSTSSSSPAKPARRNHRGTQRRRGRLHLQAVQSGRVDPAREHRPPHHRSGNARPDDLHAGQAGGVARSRNGRTPGTRAELLPGDRRPPAKRPRSSAAR